MSLAKRAVVGVGWVFVTSVITRALGFLTTIVLAWLLVPEDFGLVAIAHVIIGLFVLFQDFGVNQALIYERDEGAASTAFYLTVMMGVALSLVTYLSAPLAVVLFVACMH